MTEHKIITSAPPAWHFPVAVADIAETGQHFDLVAEAGVRTAVARMAGLRELLRFEANFDVNRHGGGLRVAGRVSATVGQNCVVTLEPLTNEVEEGIDLLFMPPAPARDDANDATSENQPREAKWGEPEPLNDGSVDLGALATEFLILGLDPYPRKPGAVFNLPPPSAPEQGPFAGLAKLTKRGDGT